MVKYKDYGRKILAVLLAIATVLTTSSIDLRALAAPEPTSTTIYSGGSLGEIYTNNGSNQKVTSVSFDMIQVAGIPYDCVAYIYENPTTDGDPQSGVIRKTVYKNIDAVSENKRTTINIPIDGGDDDKPIVLTNGEKLGVAIVLSGNVGDNPIQYYESGTPDTGNGYRKDTSVSGWEKRGDIVTVSTESYSGEPNDLTDITMNPATTFLTVGDDDVALNTTFAPNYKRTITYTPSNPNVVTQDNQKVHAVGSGQATLTASYGEASDTKNFTVFQNTIQAGTWTYSGSPIRPTVEVYCGNKLTEDTDYKLTYSNNINPGTASVTITGLNQYAGYSRTYNYTIGKATLTQAMVNSTKDGGTATYTIDTSTGEVKSAVIGSLTKDTDFTAVANYDSSAVGKVTYNVTVMAKGNYVGGPFTTSVDVSADPSATIDINAVVDAVLTDKEGTETDEFTYTGSDITPNVKFYLKDTDTAVDFANNVEVATSGGSSASEDVSKTLTITGKNSAGYSGTITLEYWVIPLGIDDTKISVEVQEETPGSGNVWTHTGNQIKPTVTVKYNNGTTTSTLAQGTDYKVEYYNNTDISDAARIKISGIGNFTGDRTEEFKIIGDFVKDASLKLGGYTANYSNNFVTDYSVPYRGTPYTTRISNFTLAGTTVKSNEYTTVYSNNTNAGTAEIKITGQGKYAGKEFTVKFTITPKQLTGGLSVYQQPHTYSGTQVELADGEYVVYDGGKLLTKGTDYDVAFTNNINAGTASINVTGKGNYGGTILGSYTIDPLSISDGNVTIEPIADRTYTGAAQEPPVVVKLNGVVVPSSNYTVSYSNNINVGTANVTLTGKGNFTGTRNDVTFRIKPKTLANLTYTIGGVPCTGSGTSYTSTYVADYTGLEVKPAVVVYDGGNVLTSDDYTVSYSGNINVGTATARVSGRGSYAGSTVYITFGIDYKSIENTNVTLTGTKKVNGIIYPTVTVYDPTAPYGSQDLVEGTHYEIIATATHAGAGNTAIIRGKGNYKGEQIVTYNIGHDLNDDVKTSVQVWTPNGNYEMPEESPGVYVFEYIGEQYPSIKVFYDGNALTTDDFDPDFVRLPGTNGNDFDAGTRIKVTVTGKGDNYYNSKSAQYNISRKNINDGELIAITDDSTNSTKTADWTYTYDRLGKLVKPKIVYNVKDGAAVTLADSDFSKDKNSVGPNVVYEGGLIKSIPVTFTGTGNYTGTVTKNYTINPCALTDTDVINVVDIGDQQYTGEQIRPLPVVQHTLSDASTRELVNGTDYELTYANNTAVASISSENPPTVIITAKDRGNYTGQVTKKFNIIRRTLTQTNTTVTPIPDMIYDGTPKTPAGFSVYYNETGNVLTTDDYDVVPINNRMFGAGDVAQHTGPLVQIVGKGAYEGTVYAPFTIKANIGDSNLFTVDELEGPYVIEKNGDVFDIEVDKDDFTVQYKDPYNPDQISTMDPDLYELKKPQTIVPGLAQLSVVGKGGIVYGTANKTVKLVGNLEYVTLSGIDPVYDYTGTAITPSPTVMFGTKLLTQGVDYNISYSNNTNAGTATISITPVEGNEYLTGSKSANFKIQYNMDEAVISGYESSYEYTGTQWTPSPITVTVHGNTLSNGTDYDVTYGHNTDVSEGGLITVTGKGDKTRGAKSVQFRITPVSIENAQVTFAETTYPYTGQSQRPVPVVKIGTKTLTEGVDFRVEYPTDTVNVGFKPVNIVGMGNYTGKITGDTTTGPYYHIGEVSLADPAVTIEVGEAYYAGGENVTPPYSVKYNGIPLVKDRDYTVTMDGTHGTVGTNYPITFTGINNFYGAVPMTYAIREADLSLGVVKLSETSHEYTGSPIAPSIVATIDKGDGTVYTLKEGADKDYVVTFNGGHDMIDVGTYSILVEGKNNFINSLSATYTVTAKDLSDSSKVTITYDIDNDYTGAEVRPEPVVWDIARGVRLVEGTDYTVTYANNTAAASKDDPTAPPTITVVGQGNYTGTFSDTFNIGHALGDLTVALDPVSFTYNGQIQKPVTTVKRGETSLVENEDYELQYYNGDGSELDKNVGDKKVIIRGLKGYYGETSRYYEVQAKVADASKIAIIPKLLQDPSGHYYDTYTGDYIRPAVAVYDTEISPVDPMDPDDYEVSYTDNKDMSTPTNPALIHITFKNNYAMGAESYTQSFYINPKTIETGFQAYLPGGTQYAYTGSKVEPVVKVTPTSTETTEGDLKPDEDYTLTYYNNVDAGTAQVVVTGINNYSGTVTLDYNVVANLNDADIDVEDQFYTGDPVYAPLTIKCGGNTLEEGVDYTVTYNSADNWETVGTATITPLKPYYAGEVTKDYNIVFDPSLLTVTGYDDAYGYTGKPIKPAFVVKTPSGTVLPYDPEAIVYENSSTGLGDCTSIGTVTATIPLNIGTQTCEVTAEYDIVGNDINGCYIVPLEKNVYTGKALKPPVVIKRTATSAESLVEGVDYTLSYSNNTNPGKGIITITGKGNYKGKTEITFDIISPNMLGLSATPASDTSVKLTWLRNARITGYEIAADKDFKIKYGTTTDNTYTVNGLKPGNNYTFYVRTFVKANGYTTYGQTASVTSQTGLSAPDVTVRSLARQRTTINWNTTTGVTGYEIYRSTSANGTYSKIAVMPQSAGGYSDSGLKSGGTYYYKVRGYQKVGDNQFMYGYFSNPQAVTVK